MTFFMLKIEDKIFNIVSPLPISLKDLKHIRIVVTTVDEDLLICVWHELEYHIDMSSE